MIDLILEKLKSNGSFKSHEFYPIVVIDDFLPEDLVKGLEEECLAIPELYWTTFTRRGSHMKECNKLSLAPRANDLVNMLHDKKVLEHIETLLGIDGIRTDSHLIGAGYSRSFQGDSLKIHTDFNYNDTLKLYRAASFIIYLNSDWQDHYGGHLEFKDSVNQNIIHKITPNFNKAVFWKHHYLGFHGYPEPLKCPAHMSRNTFRLFFYQQTAPYKVDTQPHRSLYWYDEEKNLPYDIRTHK